MQRSNSLSDYEQRINRVIDYVNADSGGDLSLGRLAEVASFSPYHFHRLFRSFTGEPLGRFVQRVRLQNAAKALRSKPGLSQNP